MTIVQRTFSAAFRPVSIPHRGTHSKPQTDAVEIHESPRPSASASMTSAPWEGLYFEAEEASCEPAANGTRAPVSELERFLASIMYGE
ncbi:MULTISPECIES: hypothetical protein [unclassified Arthrobacter]|uniref:hypothetical protein n=1 Tax=unclassified Arthrobacter TaxID=235627 RepID=UPI00288342B2|nr:MULTISPECIES: hypothetical protein [unclassified Arthrobacter]